MLRPSNNSTPFSKKLRHRYHYQQQRIEISAIACQHFLWNRISRLGAAVGCFLVVCLMGSWPFSSRPRDTMPSVDLVEIRVFGPTIQGNTHRALPESNQEMSFQQFSTTEQRDFLLKYGRICQSWTASDQNLLLNRFDSFQSSPYLQIELWKYCMLYIGVGNFYYDANEAVMMYDWNDVVDKIKRKRFAAIALKIGTVVDGVSGSRQRFHESLMYLSNPKSPVALSMIKVLVETPQSVLDSQDTLPISLALAMEKDLADAAVAWQLWWVSCRDLAPEVAFTQHFDRNVLRSRCPAPGDYCCQVTFDQNRDNPPILALRHPGRVNNPFQLDEPKVPHLVVDRHVEQHELVQSDRADDLPYISAVRLVDLKVTPVSILETPNFFDILVQNDCLPTQKECHHCLQRNGNCMACQEECACYCQVLCRIRPPPKRFAQELVVRPPIFRKDPARLVPRIVHQTWYEAVTPNKYPNMSRLIQSWSTSGWEYRFYDDATAAEFLSQHFPPHVREAYDALIPGAFKADLFRYCVLLIYGGVYADMDVLLESNLDHAVAPDVGFMTPIDEPGSDVSHRSCLWNGFLAVAPGHPVMAKVVELVVNHIRNRFTSVDYDDMLCPNPVLSVSHTVDTLFTCGPCILGAALNILMKRHPQTEFKVGTLDIWETEEATTRSATTFSNGDMDFDDFGDAEKDDPRWLFPGRTIILHQNKQDMGAHRFTWLEQNMIVASTDFPDYDDRSSTVEHYSKAHENVGVYGLHRLYHDRHSRVNENIRIRVLRP